MRVAVHAVLLFALIGVSPVLADELTGSRARGRQMANDVCAACHAVGPGDYASPHLDAPPFQDLSDNPAMTPISLRVLLRTPHRQMPNLILDAGETDDVIAYIESLR